MRNNPNKDSRSLYRRLHDAGIPIDNHHSDLYFPYNSTTIAIVNQAISDGVLHKKPTLFQDKVSNSIWSDAMSQYDPFWEVSRLSVTNAESNHD
jgi:hypothetical protein